MTKNVKILGNTYNGVDTLNAKEADNEGVVKFVETSDANAVAEDIKRDKTAYVNGQKVVGTSDAIVPEGECNIDIQYVVEETIENVANYETVNIKVKDGNGGYLDAGSYYQVNGALYKTQWPYVPSDEGYYKFYSGDFILVNYPSSTGAFIVTSESEYSYNFTEVPVGYYRMYNSLTELSDVTYYFDGTQEYELNPVEGTPRAALITDNKAIKMKFDSSHDNYKYKAIDTYPTTNGTYTYTAATDTFVAGGGGPSVPGMYAYKDDTLTEVTSHWLMNFGNGEYTSLGSKTTYYLYNSGGPAAMPLSSQKTYYLPSEDLPQLLDDGLYNISEGDYELIDEGNYYISDTPLVNTTITFDDSGNSSHIESGYYGFLYGEALPINGNYVYLLGSGSYETLDGYYFCDAANNTGKSLSIINGQTWYMNSEDSYLLTNTLRAFMDQGQTTTFDDMTVGTDQTITFVDGKQFKITRIQ